MDNETNVGGVAIESTQLLERIVRSAFASGESWGVLYSTWYEPSKAATEEKLQRAIDDAKNIIRRSNASVSISGDEPEYAPRDCSVSGAVAEAVAAIYFDDNSDYRTALLNVIRNLDAEAYDMTLTDTSKAYDKYCEQNAVNHQQEEVK